MQFVDMFDASINLNRGMKIGTMVRDSKRIPILCTQILGELVWGVKGEHNKKYNTRVD